MLVPGLAHAGVEAEGNAGGEREGGVLAPVVVAGGERALDGAGLDGVEHLQAGHDLAGREKLNLEAVVGHLGNALDQGVGGAVQRVEHPGKLEARRHLISGSDWAMAGAATCSCSHPEPAAAPSFKN